MAHRGGGRGFGAPKPLPGQKGYKMRESERLEREAAQMENRLKDLRDQMSKEQAKRQESGSVGDSRWRSASKARGGVRQYAKDVKSRPRQQQRRRSSASSAAAEAAAPPKQAAPAPVAATGGYASKDVSAWAVSDSVAWLDASGLGQYGPAFEANEIAGSILLELGLDDLDYMKITVLGHRKRLLKGIEGLKRGEVGTAASPAVATAMAMTAAAATAPESPAEAKRVHWSHVAPLSENQTQGDGNVPVNLADGDFNEADSHASFMQALMEWRTGGAEGAGPGAGAGAEEAPADDGMWQNPFGAATQAGQEDELPEPSGNGELLAGALDEEAEHENFVKAVEQWRSGGSAAEHRHGCWQCYQVGDVTEMIKDAASDKLFCSQKCVDAFTVASQTLCASPACAQSFLRPNGVLAQGKRFCSEDCAARGGAPAEAKASSASSERLEKLRAEIEALEEQLNDTVLSGSGSDTEASEIAPLNSARIAQASPIASPPGSPIAEYTVDLSDSDSDSAQASGGGVSEAKQLAGIWDVDVKF